MKTRTLSLLLALVACLPAASAATLTPGAVGDAEVAAAVSGRVNVALASAGGVAFSSSDLGANYSAPDVNDGIIDHTGFSWIPANASVNQFVGVRFAAASDVGGVVWHGQTGYNGRSGATYSLEYSTDVSPGAGSTWTAIGSYTYTEPGCATPMGRTYFAFTPIANVTGIRLLLTAVNCGIEPAIQELEAYAPAVISPGATGDAAVAGAIAGRPNLCLASAGGVPFSSSDLGPNYTATDVNDGVIDHTGFSWIPSTAAPGQFVGVGFATPADVDSVVWHGQTGYNGRSGGTYSLEYSKELNPNGASSWIAIGNYTYTEAGCNTPMPRSIFSFPVLGNVTGLRLVLRPGCGIEPAVQELEAYGPLVTPPIIITQPTGGTFTEGDVITLTVVAEGGTAYQWSKNGVAIPGATAATYVIPNASLSDAGSYTVRVANAAGNLPSDPAVVTITAAPVFATYTEAVLADNPIHYYPLDEIGGTVAADLGSLSTGGGTYTGGITLGQATVTSRLGRAARFDGAPGTFVDLGLFHVGDTLTVEAWANLDTSANNNPAYHAIVARWDGSYELDFAPGDIPNLVVRNNNNAFGLVAGASASTRAQWHHLVGVFAGGVMTIYVDGVKGSEVDLGGVLQDAGPEPNRVLIGGTRSGTVASFNFRGLIDEVAIYDTALSAAQVRSHFRAAVPPGGPTITIQPAVLLSWPAFPPNYVLQSAPKIDGPYAPYVGSAPVLEDGAKKVTVPIGTEHKFFRLFQQ